MKWLDRLFGRVGSATDAPEAAADTAIAFVPPWRSLPLGDERQALTRQLRRELSPAHPLYGTKCSVTGRSDSNDDILVEVDGRRFAIVHLVWGGPGSRDFPTTDFFETAEQVGDAIWVDAVCQGFIEDFDPADPRLEDCQPGGGKFAS